MIEPEDFTPEFKKYRKGIFESHGIYILKRFLNPWLERHLSMSLKNNLDISNERLGVIIDDRPNTMLRFSVLNTLLMTDLNLPVQIYTTKKSLSNTKKLFSDVLDFTNLIKINTLEIDSINIDQYNNLLKSTNFWSSLIAKQVLIFQTDTLIIEPLEFTIFNYDYIGALFSKGKSRCISIPHFNKDTREEDGNTWITQKYNEDLSHGLLMGNGGLSIRNCETMKAICSNETSYPNENEDIFFSKHLKKYTKNLPSHVNIINRFSIEADFHKSVGYHGSHFYLDHSELSSIYDRHIRTVMGLLSSFN